MTLRRLTTILGSVVLCSGFVIRAQQPPKLRLAEVQDVAPVSYRVELNLDPAKDTFSGVIHIRLNVQKPLTTLWLNTAQLTLQKMQIESSDGAMQGTSVPGCDDFTGLKFSHPVPSGEHDLSVEYTGHIRSGQPTGIFVSEDSGNRYLLTQFEDTDARAAFPCFDEPGYKVPWQLTLHVPAAYSTVSNTPVQNESTAGDGKTVTYQQTKPLPSYLVAFGVGAFEFVNAGTAGKNHVPVRIVTPKGRAAEAQYAAEVTATILTRLEDYFGIPYPYEKADQVAVPRPIGLAMENAGMVTYGATIILAKPESDTIRRQHGYAEVAAHELAHQWFGDLVTTAWWNDIWLNEAFATWMEEKLISDWKPGWHSRASDVSSHLFAENQDGLPSTRRIRQPIENSGDIHNAFDSITYQKGATVIGMFENWIGEAPFREGVRRYLTRYALKNATTDDFLNAIGEASGKDVRSAFSTFTDQPGVPVLKVGLQCGKDSSPRITLEQNRFSSLPGQSGTADQLWQIPVCVRYPDGSGTRMQCSLLKQKSEPVALETKTCPAWLNANADAKGYYLVAYEGNLLSALSGGGDLEQRLKAPERVSLLGDLQAAADANLVSYPDALSTAAHLHDDPVPAVVQTALGTITHVHGTAVSGPPSANLIPPAAEPAYQRFIADTFAPRALQLGWLPKDGETEDAKLVRPDLLKAVATLGGNKQLAQQVQELASKWLAGDRSLDPAMLQSVLATAAFYTDAAAVPRYLAAIKETQDLQMRERAVFALTSLRDPEALRHTLQALSSGEIPGSYALWFLIGSATSDKTRKIPLEFVRTHYADVEKLSYAMYLGELPFIGSSFCDSDSERELQAVLQPHLAETPGMKRPLSQVVETIEGCIATKKFQTPKLEAFFK